MQQAAVHGGHNSAAAEGRVALLLSSSLRRIEVLAGSSAPELEMGVGEDPVMKHVGVR